MPQELALSWMCSEDDVSMDAAELCRLSLLPSLHTLELHLHKCGARESLSLAPLTRLHSLTLLGCNSMELGLSVAHLTGLSRLVWRDSQEMITVDLIVQVGVAGRDGVRMLVIHDIAAQAHTISNETSPAGWPSMQHSKHVFNQMLAVAIVLELC